MTINPTRLTDGEMSRTFVEMAQAITLQALAMTAHVEQQGVPRENPPYRTMPSRLSGFTKVNPPVYAGSKIVEDIREECGEAMLHDSIDLSRLLVDVQQVGKNQKEEAH